MLLMVLPIYDFARGVVLMINHWRCTKGICQNKICPQINNMHRFSMLF